VLRPAMVVVAKGGVKPGSKPAVEPAPDVPAGDGHSEPAGGNSSG
jgi:hypothetical protein